MKGLGFTRSGEAPRRMSQKTEALRKHLGHSDPGSRKNIILIQESEAGKLPPMSYFLIYLDVDFSRISSQRVGFL